MVIFGRWALWATIAFVALVLLAAFAFQNPVWGVALAAIALILAVTAWRNRSPR